MSFAIVIMAAGKGTRLKSKRPKVLHQIGGKPLLAHVIAAAQAMAAPQDIFVVVGHGAEQVKQAVAHTGVQFVTQHHQRGTGDAVAAAAEAIQGYHDVLVLSGDVPLLKPETIRALSDYHLAERSAMTILTVMPPDPHGYGRIKRRSGSSDEVECILEQKGLSPELASSLREVNTGIYAFQTGPLLRCLPKLQSNNAQGELYLTDVAAMLVHERERVLALELDQDEDIHQVLGANTIAEMMDLDRALRRSSTRRLMAQGVTIFQPETVVIDAGVEVGADTVIEPFVQLLGSTQVGERCYIRSYSVIENSTLADEVTLRQGCILETAHIDSGAILGPYAHLRPDSRVGQNAHIGNFVELKNATMERGAKANHLAYLGDVTVGEQTNIGAGTIISNYDGVDKHHTEIGEHVFIGSNSVLVAPIEVGAGAYVAASSCITEAVPADALALGRARQVNKEGWAARRRAALAQKRAGD